jgi:hypothetical protein
MWKINKMNFFQKLAQAFGLWLAQPVSFIVDKTFKVTVQSLPGTVPNHLSFNQFFDAIEAVLLLGGIGTVQVGDVSFSVEVI